MTTLESTPAPAQPYADQLVDELLPGEFDWRSMVRSYPKAALALAAVGGYLLGRSRGAVIVSALGAYASDAVSQNINAIVGEEIL